MFVSTQCFFLSMLDIQPKRNNVPKQFNSRETDSLILANKKKEIPNDLNRIETIQTMAISIHTTKPTKRIEDLQIPQPMSRQIKPLSYVAFNTLCFVFLSLEGGEGVDKIIFITFV